MSRLRSNSHKTSTVIPNPEDDPYWTEYRSQFTYFVDPDINPEEEQEDVGMDELPVYHNSQYNLPSEPQRVQLPPQNYQEIYSNPQPVQYEVKAPYKQDDYANFDQKPNPRYQSRNEPQYTEADLKTKIVVRDINRSNFAHYGNGNIKPSNPDHYLHTHNITASNKVYPEAQMIRSQKVSQVPRDPSPHIEPPKPVAVSRPAVVTVRQDPPAFVPSVNFDSLDKPIVVDTPHYLKGTKATAQRNRETKKQLKQLDDWKQFNTRAVRYVVTQPPPQPQEQQKPKKKKILSMYNNEDKSAAYEENSISLRFREIEHERVQKPTKSQNALGSKQGSGVSQAISAAQVAHQPTYAEPSNIDNRSYFAIPVVEQQQYYQPPSEYEHRQDYSRPSSVSSTGLRTKSATFDSTQAFAPRSRDHLNPKNYKQFPSSVLVNIPAAGVSSPKSPALHIIGSYK